jgi:hypothetical protein
MLIVGPIVELGNVARRVRGEIQIERLLVGSRRNELSRNHRNLTRSIRMPRVETSCRDWRVRQRATMRLPAVRVEARASTALLRRRCRRSPVQPRMRAIPVEVALELEELHLKVGGRPEQRAIHALASNGPNQTLDEAAGALHPQALQIGMTIANRGSAAGACRGKDARAESRAKNAAVAHHPAMGNRRPFMAFLRACRRSRRRPYARPQRHRRGVRGVRSVFRAGTLPVISSPNCRT